MKGTPTVPAAFRVLVMTGGNSVVLMVMTSVLVLVPAEFVAEIDTFVTPAAVGVPEMTPVVVLTDSPGGRPVALNDVGELVAVMA